MLGLTEEQEDMMSVQNDQDVPDVVSAHSFGSNHLTGMKGVTRIDKRRRGVNAATELMISNCPLDLDLNRPPPPRNRLRMEPSGRSSPKRDQARI